jgi:hypothetical protein
MTKKKPAKKKKAAVAKKPAKKASGAKATKKAATKKAATKKAATKKAATKKAGAKKPTATKKATKPAAKQPKAKMPSVGVPRGYDSREHEMRVVPSSVASEEDRWHATNQRALKERHDEILKSAAAAAPPAAAPHHAAREQALITALAEAHRVPHPPARVRPEYFGTAEHKALGDLLQAIMNGQDPWTSDETDVSHLLWHAKTGSLGLLDAPLDVSALDVYSTRAEWQQQLASELTETTAGSFTERELPIRDDITLRYGDIIALAGDFYATPDELQRGVSTRVRGAIRGVTPSDSGTFWLTTYRSWIEYGLLALDNVEHFTPHNWYQYARHHLNALDLALDRNLDGALVRNAFADHFLTDAFASGHTRTPRLLPTGKKLGAVASKRMHDEENEHGLWFYNREGYVWHGYGDDRLGFNQVHLSMTAIAVSRSIRRVFKAYRLEGDDADTLRSAVSSARDALPADSAPDDSRDPSKLPDVLGDAGVGLPDLRAWIPADVPQANASTRDVIANYPPMYDANGDSTRDGTPDFSKFFSFQDNE